MAKTLQWRWREFTKHGVSDLGIFIDWCGMHQAPRTARQQRAFTRALRSINLWYAHQGTTVWCVTGGVDNVTGLGYHNKGWPSFEYRLAMMIKVSNDSFHSDWPQVLDLGKKNLFDVQWKNLTRAAPAEPLAFFGGHEYGEKKYTNGADRDKIVAPKCAPSPIPNSASCALCMRGAPHSRCAVCAGFGRRPLSSWAA